MHKHVFGRMRTSKAQISLRIRAVLSWHSLPSTESFATYEAIEEDWRHPDWSGSSFLAHDMIIFHLAAHLNPARRIRNFPVICVEEDSRAACAFTHLPRIHTEKTQTTHTAQTFFSRIHMWYTHVSAIPKNNSLTIHALGHVKQSSAIEYMRIPKVQATLCIRTVFLEPVLFAHVRRNAHRNIDSTESPNNFFFSFFLAARLISTFCSHLRQCVKLVNPVWQRQRWCMPYLHLSPHKCKQYHR